MSAKGGKRGGKGGWTIIRATWSGITPRYIWLGEKICVAENLKPFTSGIGLLNYCIEVAVNEKCDFSWKRMSITRFDEARSPKSVRIGPWAQLSGQSMPIQSNCFNNHDGISRCFPRFEMWIVRISFFFFLFSFYFVCLFVCSFLVFFSFFRWKFPFCISYKRECLDRPWCPLLFTLIDITILLRE